MQEQGVEVDHSTILPSLCRTVHTDSTTAHLVG